MKKKNVLGIILLISLVLVEGVFADVIEVPDDQATIQEAITAATAGDTINVSAGIYEEDLTIDKSLTLQGTNAVVNGIHTITANDITIDGFNLNPNGGIAIIIDSSASAISNINIENNIFDLTTGHPIGIILGGYTAPQKVSNVKINDNVFNGPEDMISNPWKIGGWFGESIGCEVENVDFENNIVNKGSIPINLHDKNINDILINNNVFRDTDGVVYVWEDAAETPTGILSNFVFTNNYVDSTNTYGVGIDVFAAFNDSNFGTGNTINYNKFTGIPGAYGFQSVSILADLTAYELNAKNNWWNDLDPSDDVSSNVDYSNWALDSNVNTFQIEDISFDEDSSKIIDLDDYYNDNEALVYVYLKDDDIEITELGNNEIKISATENWYDSSDVIIFASGRPQNTFTVTVNAVNDAPIITDIPNQTIDEAQTFTQITLDNYVDDVDNLDSEITWSYSGNTELTVDITNRIATITIPDTDWFGSETITFTANDSELTDSDDAIFTVNNVNDAPIITAIADQTATEETEFLYQVTVTDADQDTLTYFVTGPDGMIITSNGYIWWQPTNEQALTGTANVVVEVSDETDSDTESFTITVTNVNDAPVLTAIGTQQPVVGRLYTYQAEAEDVDTATLTFSDNSTLFNIDPTTGIISFTPASEDIGQYNVEITVSDGELTDSEIVLFDISKLNQAPVSIIIPTQSWDEGATQTLNISEYFSDPDQDELTFSIKTQPTTIIAELEDNIVTFTQEDENFFGTDSIIFSASDGINITDSNIVILTVNDVNDEPEIKNYSPTTISFSIGDNVDKLFSIDVSDIDEDTLNYKWYLDNDLISGATTNSYTFNSATAKTYNIKVEISDKEVTISKEWTLTVSDIPVTETFTEETTDFSTIADLSKAIDIVLAKEEGKIDFGDQELDLSEVIDLDNNVIISKNIIGINTQEYSTQFNKPATLTMKDITLNQPVIYYTDEFITTYDLTNAKVCDFCSNIQYSNGILTFDVEHFTTFMAGEEVLELDISDLEVKVDSKTDKTITNNGIISKEALPGSTVKVKIEVKNNLQDLEIEDIYVEATLIGIDDGEDLEEESNEFDLKKGRDKTITLTFEIPKQVDEDTYDLDIYVNGEDENGTEHEVVWTVYLEVEKEKHNVEIERLALLPGKLSCVRNTKLNFAVVNYGREEEEEAAYSIFSEALGIDKKEYFELSEDLFSEDSELSKSVPIKVSEDFPAGTYPIEIKAYYDKDKLDDTETIDLVIEECEVMPLVLKEGITVIKKEEEKKAIEKKEEIKPKLSFRETPEYIALLVGGIVIILVLVILAFAALAVSSRRR